jgi:sugar lactone lactonase YvrE
MQPIHAEPFYEPQTEALRYLPEGPRILRNYPGRKLGWVAIQHAADDPNGSVNMLDLETRENRSFPVSGRPGFLVETTRPGMVLLGLERRLVTFDLTSGEVHALSIPVTDDERVIINDGLAVEGGVLFGTKHLEFNRPIAKLYFFDARTREVRTVAEGQTCSNGKFAQGDMLIDIDSTPKAIHRYRIEPGYRIVGEKSLVAPPDSLPGYPDGLRPVDGESVVVAFFNPDRVADGCARQIRLADGETMCEWRIPGSPRVTCPEFAERDGKLKLLFTTATEGMPEDTRSIAPGAGSMYIADVPAGIQAPQPPPLLSL